MEVTDLAANTTAVVTMITSLATGAFTIFPLNILIVMGLCGGAFKLFHKGKKAAVR